jgi:hypothetical protein
MKLPCSNPWRNRSAIHAASPTSVLRPYTVRMWWALTTNKLKEPSRRL